MRRNSSRRATVQSTCSSCEIDKRVAHILRVITLRDFGHENGPNYSVDQLRAG